MSNVRVLGEKMNYLSKIIILVLSMISLSANADSDFSTSKECEKVAHIVKKYEHLSLEGYQCGKDIKNLKRFKLNGLKLFAAFAYDDYGSSAYYTGDKVFDGVISYPDGPNDTFAFQTKNGYFSFGGGGDVNNLKSINYPAKYNDDGTYELSTCKSGEMKGKAKMRIKFVHDVKAESCQEGSWLYDYEIISVGKYSCRQ